MHSFIQDMFAERPPPHTHTRGAGVSLETGTREQGRGGPCSIVLKSQQGKTGKIHINKTILNSDKRTRKIKLDVTRDGKGNLRLGGEGRSDFTG